MRPARQCRCQKASFAAPAGRPIPRVGSAVRTAVSTRCGPDRTARSASTWRGSSRSSSSAPARRMNVVPQRAAAPLARMRGRNNNSANAAAMVARNVRSNNVERSNSDRRNSRPRRRKPRENGQDVAAVAAAALAVRKALRNRLPQRRSNRAPRASRDLPARRNRPGLPQRREHLPERAADRKSVDAFAVGGVEAGAGRKADRPRRSEMERRRLGGWPGGVPPPTHQARKSGGETPPSQPAGRQRSVLLRLFRGWLTPVLAPRPSAGSAADAARCIRRSLRSGCSSDRRDPV